ncbi:hypothetical protein SAMN04515647_0513 [Cohaesibacter sp. ES.047]|uniref:SF0329 family protein n=1 Tax=Cohaesibacter sp. ES.047 TaxID=1798205 RepID=UPI000BB6B508|nr:hypothetical protein [Cohaesibacter sp. ES.047]SNY90349.1 hypothetical protein SAMN04515647_0513 [Cohaesibacter sp. ES.047]
MRWSKLKKLVESNFADPVASRVAIHSTRYGGCTCGHAWFALDGEVVANFCTRAYFNRFAYGLKEEDQGVSEEQAKRYRDQPVEYGEINRQDLYESCWAYVHDISFQDALKSDDPLIQAFVMLDKRLGKRRIATLDREAFHPLAIKMLDIRLAADQSSAARTRELSS